jgi:hypothetical protein
MPRIYGRDWSRAELRKRAGTMAQFGGVDLVELQSGRAQGVRAVRVRTGPLSFTVLPGNALDIYDFAYEGVPLAWQSAAGVSAGAYAEDSGLRFLRTFQGGLLVTCGLATMGAPSVDEGEALGLHGRIHHLPAEQSAVDEQWDGDEYVLSVSGRVREAVVFGENLVLHRRISTRLGATSISIHDVVENQGPRTTPHMMLYHVNAGFPVVDEGSRLLVNSRPEPRDEHAAKGLADMRKFTAPIPGFTEQVYWHTVTPDDQGYSLAAVVNEQHRDGRGIGLYLKYPTSQLPVLFEWKMMGESEYVVGMEPANAYGYGRATEREHGRLRFLEPGERRSYDVEIGVLDGKEAISTFEASLPRQQ